MCCTLKETGGDCWDLQTSDKERGRKHQKRLLLVPLARFIGLLVSYLFILSSFGSCLFSSLSPEQELSCMRVLERMMYFVCAENAYSWRRRERVQRSKGKFFSLWLLIRALLCQKRKSRPSMWYCLSPTSRWSIMNLRVKTLCCDRT